MSASTERRFDCADIERFCYAYLDGEFASQEREQFETHLAGCSGCKKQVEEASAFRSMVRLRVKPGVRAPAHLRARISRGLVQAQRERSRKQFRAFAWQAWPSALIGGAVALCLAMVYGLVAPSPSTRWVVNDAVDMHSRALPLEVTTADLGHLLPLFEHHLGFAVQPPQFPARRAVLVGGRLSHLGPRDAAYLEYGTGPGRRLSILVAEDQNPSFRLAGARVARVANREVFLTTVRGHNVTVWRTGGVIYSMVSDLDEADNLSLLAASQPAP
jgi:anti-sigma factor (TIGR02949 family)